MIHHDLPFLCLPFFFFLHRALATALWPPLALRWMPIGIGLPCCDLLFFLQTALCDAFRLHTDMLEGSGHRMSCLERGYSKHESGPDPAPPPRCPVHAHDRIVIVRVYDISLSRARLHPRSDARRLPLRSRLPGSSGGPGQHQQQAASTVHRPARCQRFTCLHSPRRTALSRRVHVCVQLTSPAFATLQVGTSDQRVTC